MITEEEYKEARRTVRIILFGFSLIFLAILSFAGYHYIENPEFFILGLKIFLGAAFAVMTYVFIIWAGWRIKSGAFSAIKEYKEQKRK